MRVPTAASPAANLCASNPPAPFIWQAALAGNLKAPMPRPGFQKTDWAYHQQVVDHLVNALQGAGVTIITEVDLLSVTGRTARADFMGVLPGYGGVVCTEVKTSLACDDYEKFNGDAFGRMQAAVLSLVPIGGHVQ